MLFHRESINHKMRIMFFQKYPYLNPPRLMYLSQLRSFRIRNLKELYVLAVSILTPINSIITEDTFFPVLKTCNLLC